MESSDETRTESTPEAASPKTDDRDVPAPSNPIEPSSDGDNPDASGGQPDHSMPDASSLVAMAAMHMETLALIHVLVSIFDAHAWRSMGLVADHSGEVRKDLPSAQIAIDCLAFLLGKVEASLDEPEKRDVQRRLMDLRMNYVAKTRED
jgi:hypothetical protein